jgi:hypothetical protein
MPRAEIFSTFQALAEFRRRHAGVVTEKAAEMKFAGEIELAGNVLDGKPFVSARSRRVPARAAFSKIPFISTRRRPVCARIFARHGQNSSVCGKNRRYFFIFFQRGFSIILGC